MILTSNVIDTVIAQAAYQAEIEATRGTLVLLHEQVRIAEAQATGGTVPYANVLSLESQTASVEATVPVLEDKVDQASDLLAALTGAAPSSWRLPPVALEQLALPQDLPVEVPSQLVRRRPDILVAEAELRAANAQIGVATEGGGRETERRPTRTGCAVAQRLLGEGARRLADRTGDHTGTPVAPVQCHEHTHAPHPDPRWTPDGRMRLAGGVRPGDG